MEYEYIEDVERLDYYKPGGYHPISIGDRLRNRYRIVHKLGYGTYSTTWLAGDEERNRFVAVKVGIVDSGTRETDILTTLAETKQPSTLGDNALIPCLLDRFEVEGPNGIHPCYVTAPARSSLSDAKEGSYIRLFSLEVARALAAQLALAVAYTHAQGYVHGDLHLGNVLLRLPRDFDSLSVDQLYERYGAPELEPVRCVEGGSLPPGVPPHVVPPIWLGKPSEKIQLPEARIFLADFGEAFSPLRESRSESHTPVSIRPPEVRFEPAAPLTFSSDIWTLACSIWAILGRRPLFESFFASPDNITCEEIDALGGFPHEWWDRWEPRRQWFNEAGEPATERPLRSLEERFEDSIQEPRKSEGMPMIDPKEKNAILAMLRSMLAFRPENRHAASQVLTSEWMQKWALPEYEETQERCQV